MNDAGAAIPGHFHNPQLLLFDGGFLLCGWFYGLIAIISGRRLPAGV